MTPPEIYEHLIDILPDIDVDRYHQYKNNRNSIWFKAMNGNEYIFSFIAKDNWSLRTIKYERILNKEAQR